MKFFPRTLPSEVIRQAVEIALEEELAKGDVTSIAVIHAKSESQATIHAEAEGVIAGIELARSVFRTINAELRFDTAVFDGDRVAHEDVICTVAGNSRAILAGERVALNFLQHLSGIATFTAAFCDVVKTSPVQIAATRKTTPGSRYVEKWAVMIGGGSPHRLNLSDGVLIKDNHLMLFGGDVALACRQAREQSESGAQIEVEIDSLDQLPAAIDGGADIVLLDNMTAADVKLAVALANRKVRLEVSGGISLENVAEYAAAGPNIISVGALTQSAPALAMGLDLVPQPRQ